MSAHSPADQHRAAVGKRLTHLAGLTAHTVAAERAILAGARDRLQVVESALRQLGPRAPLDDTAAAHFAALTAERGQLTTVIARARQALL